MKLEVGDVVRLISDNYNIWTSDELSRVGLLIVTHAYDLVLATSIESIVGINNNESYKNIDLGCYTYEKVGNSKYFKLILV